MGCRILVGYEDGCEGPHEQATMIDSVSSTSFGPVTYCVETLRKFTQIKGQDPRVMDWTYDMGPNESNGWKAWYAFHEKTCGCAVALEARGE